jgi:hypothetical protein
MPVVLSQKGAWVTMAQSSSTAHWVQTKVFGLQMLKPGRGQSLSTVH